MIREIFFGSMVISFFGLGVCDLLKRDWRLGISGVLLAIVQILIWYKRG